MYKAVWVVVVLHLAACITFVKRDSTEIKCSNEGNTEVDAAVTGEKHTCMRPELSPAKKGHHSLVASEVNTRGIHRSTFLNSFKRDTSCDRATNHHVSLSQPVISFINLHRR